MRLTDLLSLKPAKILPEIFDDTVLANFNITEQLSPDPNVKIFQFYILYLQQYCSDYNFIFYNNNDDELTLNVLIQNSKKFRLD